MDENVKDFLYFRKMLTPVVIQILFWVGVVVTFIGGIVQMFSGQFWMGLIVAVVGPFVVRVFTELILVTFKINSSLTEIRNVKLKEQKDPTSTSVE
ncbi:MAG: DUF4282 domain-containing protein [Bacteroidota bacterium]|nr:DUF4282 domain-containing protein [Bacteroidota bacterium]